MNRHRRADARERVNYEAFRRTPYAASCAVCGVPGWLETLPDAAVYPGDATALVRIVKRAFPRLLIGRGAPLCEQCAAVLPDDR